MKRMTVALPTLVLLALSIFPVRAQQYKYETPMPPGVLAPDTPGEIEPYNGQT
jgi:hypothetical protein